MFQDHQIFVCVHCFPQFEPHVQPIATLLI